MTENMKNKDVTSLVSVVVPIYNVESYLKECVDSILFQTYKNIEVILVDDESPDSCGKMCDDYEKMDTRIKVVHKKNGGLSDARNAGMKVATGDLITFVDSDDYISKDFIEILFEAMLENKSDIAIANMKRTSKRDEKNTSTAWKTSNFKSEDALISMLYGIPFGTSACGKLFKRNLFKGVEFPYGKFSEDLFTIYKTILKSKSVTYVEFDGYFYYYRDEGSIVVSGYKEKHLEALDAVDDIAGAVKGKTQFDNALSTQYINVIYDIAARNPQPLEFRNKRIDRVFKYIGFYAVGVFIAGKSVKAVKKKVKAGIVAIVLLALSFSLSCYHLTMGIMWFVTAMIGVVAVILISQLINENRILQYFGRISLIILCIHGPVYRIVVKIVSILLNLGTDAVRENFLLAMVVVVITMAICSTAYEVVVRLAPWMVGKKKVKEN